VRHDVVPKSHPHMLRHACGYALANKGHDTRAIQGWLAQVDHQHGGLYGPGAEQVQGLLAGLATPRIRRGTLFHVEAPGEDHHLSSSSACSQLSQRSR
jgi:site-specific recombinase XerC